MVKTTYDELVSLIYDAAIDGSRWNEVPVALSRTLGTPQSTLEIYDPYSGFSKRYAPLCDPAYIQSFRDYYGRFWTMSRRTEHIAVGELFDNRDLVHDREAFSKSIYYNEWWLPQGVGGASLCANVVRDGNATALVAAYKPFGEQSFTESERTIFALAVGHLIRAIAIHRRLRLAELTPSEAEIPDSFLIIDSACRVLLASDAARLKLRAAGLLVESGLVDRVYSPTGKIENLAAGKAGPSAGSYLHHGHDGAPLEIAIIPVPQTDVAERRWLAVDRPAALLHVTNPIDDARARIEKLAANHGLTHAEAAVCIEVAKGDGRAAAGVRLGIRETTVRSHLSAIFDKLDIHRQAELVRLVADA